VIDLSGYTAASFGMAAFLGCAGIEAVRLPASTAISLNMFNGCSSLKTLGVGSGALTGGLVDLSGYTAASFGLGPFGGCASIEKVRLPAGTAISGSMFNGCSSLKTLGVGSAALTDGVIDLSGYTAASFGMAAFLGCAGIEAVRLPASTAISLNMFYGCSGLATAVFAGNTAPAIGTNAFLNVKCVAYVPDRDSGGYEAAVFTQHFSEVRSIALPAFSAVPQSQTKTEGQAASFSVTVTPGEPAPYTFKWQVSADAGASWSDIAGETGNTLNLGAVSLLQNDCRFRCVAASLVGGTASVAATLTVNAIVDAAQPSIAVQPQSSAVTADQEITLSVTATSPDGGALSYQWCKDGSAVPGATNADYKPDTGMTGTHVYYVVVTNTNNSATGSKTAIRQSDSATVTVNDAYIPRMLTDSATGISVSGMIRRYAALTVNDMTLGDDPACNTIRQRMNDDDYALLLGKEISLSQGFTGTLTITMPVGAQYNGQTVTILHCTGGTLETYTATVTDGKAVFSVTSLSPFAVFALAPVAPDIDPPTVVTTSVTDVSATGVKLNSRVVAGGGAAVTESGFIYGTVSNPVIGGACVTKVTAGSGTGSFSAALTGLEPDTAYYVRAYAINNEGTSYGAAISFRTDEDDLDDIPKTGDSSSPGVWWLLCGVSAAGIVTLIVLGKWKKAYKR
jgi:hypothetical protein